MTTDTATMPEKKKQKDKSSKRRQKKQAKREEKARKKGWRTASTADRHELYELSVQDAEAEVDLIDQAWKERRGRLASTIREDFCGTAIAAMEWVKRRPDNRAIAVDLDDEVLEWGRTRMSERIDERQRQRLTLIRDNVLTVETEPVDSVLAMNFSYYLFKTRAELLAYFKRAHAALKEDGLFLLDAYGGSEAFSEIEEDRHLDGFTYVWDQAVYNPVTGDAVNHIHFLFPDGSKMKKAFTYEWRVWTLPEIRELLIEAGFADVVVYWEGEDEETGEGNGEWSVTTRGEACEGWIAYLVAEK